MAGTLKIRTHQIQVPITLKSYLLKSIDYVIDYSPIITRSQFSYFKNKLADKILQHVKESIANSKELNKDACLFVQKLY